MFVGYTEQRHRIPSCTGGNNDSLCCCGVYLPCSWLENGRILSLSGRSYRFQTELTVEQSCTTGE